jgi:hypothetical protein
MAYYRTQQHEKENTTTILCVPLHSVQQRLSFTAVEVTMVKFKPAPPMTVFLSSYKRVFLRDPISMKIAMGLASIFLGSALLLTKTPPASVEVMTQLYPAWVWGILFLSTGILRLLFIGDSVIFPPTAKITVAMMSLYLWIHLNISSYQSIKFDAMNSLLLITIVFEVWALTHTLFPHRPPGRCTDDFERNG